MSGISATFQKRHSAAQLMWSAQISLFSASEHHAYLITQTIFWITLPWGFLLKWKDAFVGQNSGECSTYRQVWYLWLHLTYNEGCAEAWEYLFFAVVEFQFLSYAPLILYWCVSAVASRQIQLWKANVLPAYTRHCEQDLGFTLLVRSGFML